MQCTGTKSHRELSPHGNLGGSQPDQIPIRNRLTNHLNDPIDGGYRKWSE